MKSMKKIFAFLLTLSMMIGIFTTNTFAAGYGQITIKNTNPSVSMKGHIYEAYKIFDVTYNAEKTSYNYTVAPDFKTFFTSKGCSTDEAAYNYVAALPDDVARQAFAKEVYSGKGAAVVSRITATADNQVVISGLDLGYYLVYDAGNSNQGNNAEKVVASAILTTTNPTVDVNLKADVPTLDKKITGTTTDASNNVGALNQDAISAQIGEHIQFKLDSRVPDLTGYTHYNYIINDTLSAGLTFDNNVKVTIAGVDKTNECTITSNANGFTLTVSYAILKASAKNDPIVITYSATLNDKAVVYPTANKNTANLQYSNNPNDTSSKDVTPDDKVNVYTFQMDLTKNNGSNNPLAGAEFQLKDASGNYIALNREGTTSKYIVAPGVLGTAENSVVVSGADGKVYVDGLKAGTYTLTEIKAPDGYNMLTEPVTMTISAMYNAEKTDVTAVAGNTPVVVNKTGSLLPGTGGIGTTIFVVGGIGIMAAAVILMLLKKRKESKQS